MVLSVQNALLTDFLPSYTSPLTNRRAKMVAMRACLRQQSPNARAHYCILAKNVARTHPKVAYGMLLMDSNA